jgi:hypothetical protein
VLSATHLAPTVCTHALGMSTGGEPSWPDKHQVRHQIDRAVGRALFDQSFAARLLGEPTLAVGTGVCGQMQYVALLRHIRAEDLEDFARQLFNQFWGPAHRDSSYLLINRRQSGGWPVSTLEIGNVSS